MLELKLTHVSKGDPDWEWQQEWDSMEFPSI